MPDETLPDFDEEGFPFVLPNSPPVGLPADGEEDEEPQEQHTQAPENAATEWSLADARRFFLDNRERGLICPCCDRFGRSYRRKITSSMAAGLILLHRFYQNHPQYTDRFIHLNGYVTSLQHLSARLRAAVRGDVTKFKFWGFIEGKDGERDDGSTRNGYWRVTARGHEFARGTIAAPRRVITYNDAVLGWDDRTITIEEALGNKFNYRELMAT